VPEAAIHEHDHSLTAEGEVGATRQVEMATPALDVVLAEQGHHPQLRRGIPELADTGHIVGPWAFVCTSAMLVVPATHRCGS
jgi:hypothetical protein